MVRPQTVPAVPQDERDAMPRGELWLRFFKVVLPPLLLVLSVLGRSEEHTSELQSLMRISYAVFCLKKKNKNILITRTLNKKHGEKPTNNYYQVRLEQKY